MSDQADNMAMAKVLTRITFVIVAIGVRKPLFSVAIGVFVMRLMKTHFVDRIRHTFHAYEEQRGYKKLEDYGTHPLSVY